MGAGQGMGMGACKGTNTPHPHRGKGHRTPVRVPPIQGDLNRHASPVYTRHSWGKVMATTGGTNILSLYDENSPPPLSHYQYLPPSPILTNPGLQPLLGASQGMGMGACQDTCTPLAPSARAGSTVSPVRVPLNRGTRTDIHRLCTPNQTRRSIHSSLPWQEYKAKGPYSPTPAYRPYWGLARV